MADMADRTDRADIAAMADMADMADRADRVDRADMADMVDIADMADRVGKSFCLDLKFLLERVHLLDFSAQWWFKGLKGNQHSWPLLCLNRI